MKIINNHKVCNQCKENKLVSFFSKRTIKSGALSYKEKCKKCFSYNEKQKTRLGAKEIHDLPNEIWKEIKGYSNYLVSNLGRVKSCVKNARSYDVLLKLKVNTNGYYSVALVLSNKGVKRISVHRLVAIAFVVNPFNLPIVNHKNSNRTDNNYNNLEWCTHKQNMEHAKFNNRMQVGKNRPNRVLNEQQVLSIFKSSENQRQLAKMYNVNQGTIAAIKSGKNWSYLTKKDHIKKYTRCGTLKQ